MKRFAFALAVAAVMAASKSMWAATVVVSPAQMDGWAFYSTDDTGTINTGANTAEMVSGPATPPLGTGSAHLATASGAGDSGAELRNSSWAGTRIADITTWSYATYVTASNATPPDVSQATYLNVYVDWDNNGTRDDRLFFEPVFSAAGAGNGNANPQPDPVLNTWQTWDLVTGMWYSDTFAGPGSDAQTLQAYLAAHPDAAIINDLTSQVVPVGGIRVNAGFASPEDNLNVNVDAFTIGTAGGTTTYDFELANPVPVPAAAWMGMSLLGALGLARKIRSRRSCLA